MVAAKTITPNAIKKLLAKAWCARQIMWPNQQNGILVEVGGDGYYLVTPGAVQQREMDSNLLIAHSERRTCWIRNCAGDPA